MRLALREKHQVWTDVQNSLRGKLQYKEAREEYMAELEATDDDDEKERLEKAWKKKISEKMIAQTLMQQRKFIALCDYINDNPDSNIVDPTVLLATTENPHEKDHLERVNMVLMEEISNASPRNYSARDKSDIMATRLTKAGTQFKQSQMIEEVYDESEDVPDNDLSVGDFYDVEEEDDWFPEPQKQKRSVDAAERDPQDKVFGKYESYVFRAGKKGSLLDENVEGGDSDSFDRDYMKTSTERQQDREQRKIDKVNRRIYDSGFGDA